MKKSFTIGAKGTLANLLHSVKNVTAGDPAKSCHNMVATKRPEVSLS